MVNAFRCRVSYRQKYNREALWTEEVMPGETLPFATKIPQMLSVIGSVQEATNHVRKLELETLNLMQDMISADTWVGFMRRCYSGIKKLKFMIEEIVDDPFLMNLYRGFITNILVGAFSGLEPVDIFGVVGEEKVDRKRLRHLVEEDFNRAAQINSHDPRLLFCRGLYYTRNGSIEPGVTYFSAVYSCATIIDIILKNYNEFILTIYSDTHSILSEAQQLELLTKYRNHPGSVGYLVLKPLMEYYFKKSEPESIGVCCERIAQSPKYLGLGMINEFQIYADLIDRVFPLLRLNPSLINRDNAYILGTFCLESHNDLCSEAMGVALYVVDRMPEFDHDLVVLSLNLWLQTERKEVCPHTVKIRALALALLDIDQNNCAALKALYALAKLDDNTGSVLEIGKKILRIEAELNNEILVELLRLLLVERDFAQVIDLPNILGRELDAWYYDEYWDEELTFYEVTRVLQLQGSSSNIEQSSQLANLLSKLGLAGLANSEFHRLLAQIESHNKFDPKLLRLELELCKNIMKNYDIYEGLAMPMQSGDVLEVGGVVYGDKRSSFVSTKLLDKEIHICKQILEITPKDPEVVACLVRAHLLLGDSKKAVYTYRIHSDIFLTVLETFSYIELDNICRSLYDACQALRLEELAPGMRECFRRAGWQPPKLLPLGQAISRTHGTLFGSSNGIPHGDTSVTEITGKKRIRQVDAQNDELGEPSPKRIKGPVKVCHHCKAEEDELQEQPYLF